jgi:phosphoribosylaminoimidazole-succinocarboxamide synthase
MDLDAILHAQLAQVLDRTAFTGFDGRGPVELYEGKVRDCYVDHARRERILVISDRLSAFDQVVATIPFKGQVLNQAAQYWFEETAGIAPNHLVAVPDPNVTIARECTPLKAEFVMRAYLTGVTSTSIWRAYERGDRTFCGHALPEGMRKNEPLPAAILTPTTKAPRGAHDVSVSRDELIAMGAITAERFDEAAAVAARLFAHGQAVAARRGLILVDTKYELGLDPAGRVVVIDEIHTPDSSRYWFADDYEARLARGEEPRSLDKEYVRRWFVEQARYGGDGPPPPLPDDVRVEAAKRYIRNYELVTGRTFEPDTRPPVPRIAAALRAR